MRLYFKKVVIFLAFMQYEFNVLLFQEGFIHYKKISDMRYIVLFFTVIVFSCTTEIKNSPEKESPFGIVIHGGAGTILKKNMTPEMEQAYLEKLSEAITIGHNILKNGGSSSEAVEKTIHIMENSPLFNAGKGAVLTADATVALDASFMNGATQNAGAIAGVQHIKNPISAAIAVMNQSPHVMLSGKGAEEFAFTQGLDSVPMDYFITESRKKALERVQAKTAFTTPEEKDFLRKSRYGTVGCVALDKNGDIAAGTSTGGMTNKKWGRIGDAPIIGAGTYANNNSCGVSATGWGEFFIRSVVAYDIAAQVEYKNSSIQEAAKNSLNKVKALGGDGGVIVLDKEGNVAMEFNTAGMYRAHMNAQGELTVKIYKD